MFDCAIPLWDQQGTASRLVDQQAASRIHKQDAQLYDFDPAVAAYAADYMGWSALASNPPSSPKDIMNLAQELLQEGLQAVVLIGQGGSTQATMAVAQLLALSAKDVAFYALDAMTPGTVSQILQACDPAHTIYIVSSKSGSTLEPTLLERVAWSYVSQHLGSDQAAARRFMVITTQGSLLAAHAHQLGFRHIFYVPNTVGGRYSALTSFGLAPMACLGIDIVSMLEDDCLMEQRCAQDSLDNPALRLASFMYENYLRGRDKLVLYMPFEARDFGRWTEQLIAESLGKEGKGILPSVEFDSSVLALPHDDCAVVVYNIAGLPSMDTVSINPDIPRIELTISNVLDTSEHFLLWEYAVAMCGLLLQVNPFDQPDVESTKVATRALLAADSTSPQTDAATLEDFAINAQDSPLLERALVSPALLQGQDASNLTLQQVLKLLFASLGPQDYFTISAFLPQLEVGDTGALGRIRVAAAKKLGVVSNIGVGPRYLHSTGQFHKGGPNTGVFLILVANEDQDIPIPQENYGLGEVVIAQATGDFEALIDNDRRALLVHFADNSPSTLNQFAAEALAALESLSSRD